MKRYRVYATVTGGKYLGEVEAENARDAEEKGYNLEEAYVSLCHQCSEECEDAQVVSIYVKLDER